MDQPKPEEFDFRSPDYEVVYRLRQERLTRLRLQPELLSGLEEYYAENPVAFINDWGMTIDPRNLELDRPTLVPFILFPRQREYVDWVKERWNNGEDGLVEKSRDMGVSWLCVAIAVWVWRFFPGSIIGFGSRKEEYVDKIGDPKSLFWKIRQFISYLPQEFQPHGYQPGKHDPHMRIINPENDAVIVGEAGDNIGRGNRTSIYFKDESAFYQHPELIDAALSQTSNCKIDVSTPNGNGNPFFKKRHSGKIKVFSFHWTQDPRKDKAWYERQKELLDPIILAQEVEIDYNASTTDAWIPGMLVEAAQIKRPADITPVGRWVISIDAAHYGDDESVIHRRCGRLSLPQITLRGVDGPQLAARVEDEARLLEESSESTVGAIIIELDGPGVSAHDQLKLGSFANVTKGIHTGAQLSDNKNYNIRARLWRRAKEYLENSPCVLPPDLELKSQLASLKYGYRDGLLLMQSKKEYKKMFKKSPDRADAFILSFAADDVRGVGKPILKPMAPPPRFPHGGLGWMG